MVLEVYNHIIEELQSTSLSRGKTFASPEPFFIYIASIHFPLTREDWTGRWLNAYTEALQSTSLSRGKTKWML